MATKLWIRNYKGQPAIFAGVEDLRVRVKIADKERVLSRLLWDRLPLWTGPSPFADDGKENFPPPVDPTGKH